jgi:GTP-binding protein
VNISSAISDRGAPDLASCPDESLPEFAFIGRSNVGKSSLLNMLSGRPDLARVSRTPGFTKLINVFTMNKTWRLVDLPGYGYARVARKDKARFNRAVTQYLQHRANLCCVFTLIDSGLPPQKIDLEFVSWLIDNSVPFVLVFTKADASSPTKVQANIKAFTDHIFEWCGQLPMVFTCSATTGQGRGALLKMISEVVGADQGGIMESVERPVRQVPSAPETRRKRPDLNRPW